MVFDKLTVIKDLILSFNKISKLQPTIGNRGCCQTTFWSCELSNQFAVGMQLRFRSVTSLTTYTYTRKQDCSLRYFDVNIFRLHSDALWTMRLYKHAMAIFQGIPQAKRKLIFQLIGK